MLKIADYHDEFEQWAGFTRPCRIRLYLAPSGRTVIRATAEPFTTWLIRLGPIVAERVLAHHGLAPTDVVWISEIPGFQPNDPDLEPAITEASTISASYYVQSFAPHPDDPSQLQNTVCELVTREWVEQVLRCDLDDDGGDPPADWPRIKATVEKMVRGPAGGVLREVGVLRVPADLQPGGSLAGRPDGPR